MRRVTTGRTPLELVVSAVARLTSVRLGLSHYGLGAGCLVRMLRLRAPKRRKRRHLIDDDHEIDEKTMSVGQRHPPAKVRADSPALSAEKNAYRDP